jgi:hypothetical protein
LHSIRWRASNGIPPPNELAAATPHALKTTERSDDNPYPGCAELGQLIDALQSGF